MPGKVQQGGIITYHGNTLLRIGFVKDTFRLRLLGNIFPIGQNPGPPLTAQSPPATVRPMSYESLWQNRNFRLLFTASIGTNLGDGVLAVALPWLATLLTRDAFLIGLVATARSLPWLLFSLPMGVITDRYDRRRLILGADAARLVLVLAIAALAFAATPGTAWVLGLAGLTFMIGAVEVLRDNTAQSVLPLVVEPDELERANGQMWSAEELSGTFIGPPLAGVLIALSLSLPFGFFSVMMLISLAFVARIALKPAAKTAATAFWPALKQGLHYLFSRPELRRLAMVLGAFNFLHYMTITILVLYAQDLLGLGPIGYGALLSAQAIGGLSGSLLGPGLIKRLGPHPSLLIGVGGFALTCTAMALGAPVWMIAALFISEGFTSMLWNITTVSYRQRTIPAEMFGRVNSAYRFFGSGTMPLGAFAGGTVVAVAAPMGPSALQLPYAIAAVGAIVMMAYIARALRIG